MRKLKPSALVAALFLAAASSASADTLTLGGQFESWNANSVLPYSGWEVWAPLSLSLTLDQGFKVYGQSEFGTGSYRDDPAGTGTVQMTNFSDTILGTEFSFTNFSVPGILNVAFDIPTGDPTWEFRQSAGNLPTDFVDSRYRGRGFGVSALYGLAIPGGQGEEFGAALGYLYSGAFNPSYGGVPALQLKMGDSLFLSLDHSQRYSGGRTEIFRLSSFYSMATQQDDLNIFQLGLNFNASYGWYDPAAFSMEVGGQYWMPGQSNLGGQSANDPKNFYGPRFYISPSYAFGDFSLTGLVKYVLPNDYGIAETYYDGGGWMFSLGPSLRLKMDGASVLRLTGSFDYIYSIYGGTGQDGISRVDLIYNRWMVGSVYEVKL